VAHFTMCVQVRLMDGARLAARFNPTQTVGDLRRCAAGRSLYSCLSAVMPRGHATALRGEPSHAFYSFVYRLPNEVLEEEVTCEDELLHSHADDRQPAHACMQRSNQAFFSSYLPFSSERAACSAQAQ
jgi:hypothetical protein